MAQDVDDLFAEEYYENTQVLKDMAVGTPDRKRLLELVVAKVTSETLGAPGANPVGLTITVHEEELDGKPSLVVTATAPQYALTQ